VERLDLFFPLPLIPSSPRRLPSEPMIVPEDQVVSPHLLSLFIMVADWPNCTSTGPSDLPSSTNAPFFICRRQATPTALFLHIQTSLPCWLGEFHSAPTPPQWAAVFYSQASIWILLIHQGANIPRQETHTSYLVYLLCHVIIIVFEGAMRAGFIG